MQDFDTTIDDSDTAASETREAAKDRIWELLRTAFKRLVVLVSFGPGILGVVWLLGRIFRGR